MAASWTQSVFEQRSTSRGSGDLPLHLNSAMYTLRKQRRASRVRTLANAFPCSVSRDVTSIIRHHLCDWSPGKQTSPVDVSNLRQTKQAVLSMSSTGSDESKKNADEGSIVSRRKLAGAASLLLMGFVPSPADARASQLQRASGAEGRQRRSCGSQAAALAFPR